MTQPPSVLDMVLARLPRRHDDRGSMAMIIMVVIIAAALGGLMITMIITQSRSTRFDASRVRALSAAQSPVTKLST